ncbi:MAG: hypothetical protein H6731_01655 [Myxococcales bacterium]|nr:MAG: hypothetical protein H6731_01655 [Myxococcales bacterium]
MIITTIITLLMLSSCGQQEVRKEPTYLEDKNVLDHKNTKFNQLSNEQKDYIERFNVILKDVRDFPPKGKDINKYFYIFKNVEKLENAKVFIFGEQHTNSANQIWSAGVINRLIKDGDAVLFEGLEPELKIDNITEFLSSLIFAARTYEKSKLDIKYKPTSISKIHNKYVKLFQSTKEFLALDALSLDKGSGFGWDLNLSDTNELAIKKRNENMVKSIKNKLKSHPRVFVRTGARHIPHYEFAEIMLQNKENEELQTYLNTLGTNKHKFIDDFYSNYDFSTKIIFEFLKEQDFAVLIPKNLPGIENLDPYFPKSNH